MAEVEEVEDCVDITVAWGGSSYSVNLPSSTTLCELKYYLQDCTGVQVIRQKLIGLARAGQNPDESCRLSELSLRKKQKVMMVGTLEANIAMAPADEDMPTVVDDFDFHYDKFETEVRNDPINQEKLEDRIRNTKINIMNELRPEKRLVVLDLDYTLFDMKSSAPSMLDLRRPYLEQFMASVYEDYNIVIWSQTSWRWLELKLTELGLLTNDSFRISFVLDKRSMFDVTSHHKGELRTHQVKALELIWRQFPQYGPHNTVHVDDVERNFAMNPGSGLKIRAYRNYLVSRHRDRELLHLARYLKFIVNSNFEEIDFSEWGSVARTLG